MTALRSALIARHVSRTDMLEKRNTTTPSARSVTKSGAGEHRQQEGIDAVERAPPAARPRAPGAAEQPEDELSYGAARPFQKEIKLAQGPERERGDGGKQAIEQSRGRTPMFHIL